MLNVNFPMYSLRGYIEITEEPPYRVVTTKYGKYVLDFIDTSEGTFASRRLELLIRDPGYPLYKLSERFDGIAQIINSNRREFIDSNGKIVRKGGDDRSYRKCLHSRVLHYEVAHNGKYRLFTKDQMFVSSLLGNYVEYIELGNSSVLLNVMDDLENKRHRVLV
ncbi:hypothetical protein VPHD51_0037 [Vibrio phage D51]